MTTRKANKPQENPPPPNLTVSKAEAEKQINSRIEKGKELLSRDIRTEQELAAAESQYQRWDDFNTELLRRIFDTSELSNNYSSRWGVVSVSHSDLHGQINDFRKDVELKLTRLESIYGRLELYEEAHLPNFTSSKPLKPTGSKVFVVYGHDVSVKQSVARLLERLEIEPVLLDEKDDKGRAIIEKFEQEASVDVGYAIVLLTPDDTGKSVKDEGQPKPRARQNVIFELGYFIGRLGRSRVITLYNEGIELPSDYSGILYVKLDAEGLWALRVAKELKAAGLDVDLNKL